MGNVQRDWLPMGIIKSIQCSFVIKHVFWHRKLSEYIYICIYVHCTCTLYTDTIQTHTHKHVEVMDITFGRPNVLCRRRPRFHICIFVQLYWWSWKRWQIKRNNFTCTDGISGTNCSWNAATFCYFSRKQLFSILDGSHQWKLTVRTNDLKWFRWRKKYTRNHIENNFSLW